MILAITKNSTKVQESSGSVVVEAWTLAGTWVGTQWEYQASDFDHFRTRLNSLDW